MFEQYFGRKTGKLGYGNMRMPKVDGKLDVATACKMTDAFMKAGFSYFDTCYTYEASEKMLKEALVKRYPRESFQINTKLSVLFTHNAGDMQKMFDTSLERLGTDHVDFYFLHALNSDNLKKADEFDAWGFIRGLKEKGAAKHIGFSFHDTPELLDDTLRKHPETEMVLLQLNYLDWEEPKVQSRRLYETARKYNVPISVMEPCKGGWLACDDSEAGKLLKSANPEVSVASWAFRFFAGLEGIMTILSGMGTLGEVEDNIKTFSDFKPLTEEERELLKRAVEIIKATPSSPCTDCRYCIPHCPKNINIPGALHLYNNYHIHKNPDTLRHLYYMMGTVGARPEECENCGVCEKVCPQHIEIPDYLAKVTDLAGKD
ncbi:MAG: aldo/keto reductase [Oscillospiraceae bacterium]|nr:aldo/keto reductase [Oscillospiraceae bacterium]